MNKKRILFTIALSLVTAILAQTNLVQAANLNQAAGTLPSDEEWSIMAKASIGQNVGHTYLRSAISGGSATDYEKRILAITAIGENPRTFGEENFIAKLETFFDGNQIGDPSLLNDDIFGILALSSAGNLGNITSHSRNYILSHQNSDGGWGFASGVGSDSNTTAMAISALEQTGSIPDSAFRYIDSTKDSSGGYGFVPGTPADGASTAWVITGLNETKRSVPNSATQFLDNLQTSNGSFKWKPSDNSGSTLVTAYAVIALSGKGIPINIVSPPTNPPQPPTQPPQTPPPSSPVTSTRLCVHINYEGGCESFTNNDNDLRDNAIGNDNVSSIQVPAGITVSLFDAINFTGKCESFTTNDADLRDNSIGNDTVSSISIGTPCPVVIPPLPPPPPQPPVPPNPPIPPPPPTSGMVFVTITYPGNKIYVGNVAYSSNTSVIHALESASNQINLVYEIKQTGLGRFVQSIDGYQNSGSNGWQYAVNGNVPDVGANDYILHDSDRVQWFYGAPSSSPY
ncbi:MAG: DUF4430 domain-containing protein [Candidatus Doudnabacteria bacterium]|nr:DUF4430 domain-containing protein [Candidatus Doudnabacteria bacterium]